jgi:hypothetical protein
MMKHTPKETLSVCRSVLWSVAAPVYNPFPPLLSYFLFSSTSFVSTIL